MTLFDQAVPADLYDREPPAVAADMVTRGLLLVRQGLTGLMAGRIVEAEAYPAEDVSLAMPPAAGRSVARQCSARLDPPTATASIRSAVSTP